MDAPDLLHGGHDDGCTDSPAETDRSTGADVPDLL